MKIMDENKLDKIVEILKSDSFRVDVPISNDTEIKKFPEWDSFKHLMLLIEIENHFGIEITPEDFPNIITIGDIMKRI